MPQAQSFYEGPFYKGLTWWFVMARIGQGLRARYQVPKELPPKLLALVSKLADVEAKYRLRTSISVLDAIERNYLLPT
jgi:hypothetical protein